MDELNKKMEWLNNLPQKYQLDSNDKVDAFINGDANKVYFGPRGIGKTHMLLLDLAYYLQNNSNKRLVLLSFNNMSAIMNFELLSEMLRDIMPDDVERTIRNPIQIRLKNGSILYFLYDSNSMRGHKLDAVFLDNLDYIDDMAFQTALACTIHEEDTIFIANQTSIQEIDKALAIIRRNEF